MVRNENGLRRVSTAHLGLGKPNYCILKTSKSSTGDIFAFNKLEAHFNFYGFIFLTSLWGCPLQAPPAPHPRRAEKRWNYICPSFCPHQNSAWGEKRATIESQTNWPQIEQDSVRKPQQEKKKKKKREKRPPFLLWRLSIGWKKIWCILGGPYQMCLIGRGVCRMATRDPPWFKKNTLYSSWKTCTHHNLWFTLSQQRK